LAFKTTRENPEPPSWILYTILFDRLISLRRRYGVVLKIFPLLGIPVFFILHCGTDIPFDNELYLKRPTGLQITPLAGQQMRVQYTVQNQEDTFDGYNLLIGRVPIGDGEALSMEPLTLNGSVPTFLHSKSQYDVNTVRTVTLSRFTNVLPFEVGTTYYFRMQAHSRKGVRSEASNEVIATGLP
jgi:hypothetical protein